MQKSRFLKISLIYFISLCLFVGVRVLFQFNFLSNVPNVLQDIISTVIIQVIIMVVVPTLFYRLFFKKRQKETFNDIGFKKISSKVVLISFLIGLIAFVLNIFVSSIFNGLIQAFGYTPSSSSSSGESYSFVSFLVNVLCVAILPAFCEEYMHRGILMRGMFSSISVKHSLIISSICFGLMHLNIVQFFYATILGCLIGFVSIVGKSIWPAIIIHFVNNFINIYLSFAEANGWLFGSFYDKLNYFLTQNWLTAIFFVVLLIILLIALLFRLIVALLANTSFDNFKNLMHNIKKSFGKADRENSYVEGELTNHEFIENVQPIVMENLYQPKSTEEVFFQDNYPKEKLRFRDKIFIIATFFLGAFITISTFIWGLL